METDENVSLHHIALSVLPASLSAKIVKTLLSVTARSACFWRFALRGLIRQSLRMELSALEKSAAVGVTCENIPRDDGDRVTTQGSRQSQSGYRAARTAKFTMSLASFRAEERRREAAVQERSVRSEAGRTNAPDNTDSDLEEPWLEGTCAGLR